MAERSTCTLTGMYRTYMDPLSTPPVINILNILLNLWMCLVKPHQDVTACTFRSFQFYSTWVRKFNVNKKHLFHFFSCRFHPSFSVHIGREKKERQRWNRNLQKLVQQKQKTGWNIKSEKRKWLVLIQQYFPRKQ